MGEVNSPGVQTISGDRITLLEALTMAGDLTPSGKRDNILVIREDGDQRKTYTVDLTSGEKSIGITLLLFKAERCNLCAA